VCVSAQWIFREWLVDHIEPPFADVSGRYLRSEVRRVTIHRIKRGSSLEKDNYAAPFKWITLANHFEVQYPSLFLFDIESIFEI